MHRRTGDSSLRRLRLPDFAAGHRCIHNAPREYTAHASLRSVILLYFPLALALFAPALEVWLVSPEPTLAKAPLFALLAPPTATDSLLARAMQRLSAGDTAAALQLLEAATDRAPRSVEALYQRGRLLTRTLGLRLTDTPSHVLAWRLLNRGSDLAPTDARFALELARLRLRTPLLRADAERLFRRAATMARASGDQAIVAETLWELGRVFERRFRTSYHRYMYTGSIFFDQFAARTRLHYIRDFLQQQARPIDNAGASERAQAEQLYRDALAADPRHAPSAIGLTALLIEEQRFDEALARIQPLLREGARDPTLWFAAGLAALRLGHSAEAQSHFDRAITRLSASDRAEVLDVGRLLTTGDSVRLAGVSESVRQATLTSYWEAIDPLLSTAENEAKLEYLGRIATTMLRYDEPDRNLRGWRTDRGQVIVRYGVPPVEALLPSTDNLAARDAAGRLITVFYYPRSELGFVFVGALSMPGAVFAGDFRDIAEAVRDDSPFRLDNIALAASIDSMSTQIARFRATESGLFTVVLATAAPVSRMYRDAELDRGVIALTLRRGDVERMRLVDSQQVVVPLPQVSPLEYRRSLTLPSGEHRLRIEAVDPAVRQANGRAHIVVDLPPSRGAGVALSDLLLARRRGAPTPTMRVFADANIDALAGTRVSPRDTFALYMEAYALRPDSAGDVQIDVEVAVTLLDIQRKGDAVARWFGNVADLVGLTPEGDQQLGMRYSRVERLDGRDRVPLLVTLSLGEAPIGRYRLDVMIRDQTARTSARTSREFTISPP